MTRAIAAREGKAELPNRGPAGGGGFLDAACRRARRLLDDLCVAAAAFLWRTLFAFAPARLGFLAASVPVLYAQALLRAYCALPPWYILLDSLVGYLLGRKKTATRKPPRPPVSLEAWGSASPARRRRVKNQARRDQRDHNIPTSGTPVMRRGDVFGELPHFPRAERTGSRAEEGRDYGRSTSAALLPHCDSDSLLGSPETVSLRQMKPITSFLGGRDLRGRLHDADELSERLRRRLSFDTQGSQVTAINQLGRREEEERTRCRYSAFAEACAPPFAKTPLPPLNMFSHIHAEEDRLESLKGWQHPAKYLALENGFRVAYYDVGQLPPLTEGTRLSQPTVLCFHGSSTWSYMYRKLIPVVAAAGFRVLCLDLPGFGSSDKLASMQENTVLYHVKAIVAFLNYAIKTSPFESDSGGDPSFFTMIAHGSAASLLAIALKELPRLQGPCHEVLLLSPYLHPVIGGELGASAVERLLLLAAAAKVYEARWMPSDAVRVASHTCSVTSIAVRAVRRALSGDRACPHDDEDELAGYDAPYKVVHHRAGPAALPLLPPLPIAADPLFVRLRQLAPFFDRIPLVKTFLSHGELAGAEMATAKEWLLTGWAHPGGIGAAAPKAIYGTEDPVCKDIFLRTRFSRAVGIRNAGHYPLEDSPDETILQIMDMLRNGGS